MIHIGKLLAKLNCLGNGLRFNAWHFIVSGKASSLKGINTKPLYLGDFIYMKNVIIILCLCFSYIADSYSLGKLGMELMPFSKEAKRFYHINTIASKTECKSIYWKVKEITAKPDSHLPNLEVKIEETQDKITRLPFVGQIIRPIKTIHHSSLVGLIPVIAFNRAIDGTLDPYSAHNAVKQLLGREVARNFPLPSNTELEFEPLNIRLYKDFKEILSRKQILEDDLKGDKLLANIINTILSGKEVDPYPTYNNAVPIKIRNKEKIDNHEIDGFLNIYYVNQTAMGKVDPNEAQEILNYLTGNGFDKSNTHTVIKSITERVMTPEETAISKYIEHTVACTEEAKKLEAMLTEIRTLYLKPGVEPKF